MTQEALTEEISADQETRNITIKFPMYCKPKNNFSFQHYLMQQQQQQAAALAGNPQQPMFHPAMYGPMTNAGPMPMMGGPQYQPLYMQGFNIFFLIK